MVARRRAEHPSYPHLGRGRLTTPHNRAMTASDSPGAPASPGLGRFLTLADTAEILNISASQAYALVRSGELPAIKIGGSGHWRIERDRLEHYIADKYEENRRRGLWNQAEFADIPELFAPVSARPAESDGHF